MQRAVRGLRLGFKVEVRNCLGRAGGALPKVYDSTVEGLDGVGLGWCEADCRGGCFKGNGLGNSLYR